MKFCSCCKLEKCLSEYFKSSSRKDGLQNTCKSCMKIAANKSYKNNANVRTSIRTRAKQDRTHKRNLLRRFKRIKGCYFCDENEPCALDFHHLDPLEKDIDPSTLVNFGMEAIKTELAKCIVLCSNCHRKHHEGIEGYQLDKE